MKERLRAVFRDVRCAASPLACVHLAASPARGCRIISKRGARKFSLIGERSWRVKTGKQRQELRRSCKDRFFMSVHAAWAQRGRPAVPLTSFQVLCDGGNLQVRIKLRLSDIVENTQSRSPLRSLIKGMKSLWPTQKLFTLIMGWHLLLPLFPPFSRTLAEWSSSPCPPALPLPPPVLLQCKQADPLNQDCLNVGLFKL